MRTRRTNSLLWMMAFAGLVLGLFPSAGLSGNARTEVLVTTFPIYQITRNVTEGREGVSVSLMIPSEVGCPHDYALTPRDMQKLAKAQILIVNGLGLEEFLGTPVEKANPGLSIIDSSEGIDRLLQYSEEEEHHHDGEEAEEHEGEEAHAEGSDHAGHHHTGVNPHLFASPRMTALIAKTIAGEMAKIDPAGAPRYMANAEAYGKKMNLLADDAAALGKRLKNNRIVTQHGVLDYLARDMGLAVSAVVQAHAGQEPSASEMLEIVETMRHEQVGGIFTEPQYPDKIGATLSRETGIPAAVVDPVASGPENAPLTHYETVMRKNLSVFEAVLGVK